MFDSIVKRIATATVKQILDSSKQISFRDMIQMHIPIWLWGYLNVILNPQLGGQIQIGSMSFDFREGIEDRELMQKFKTALNEHWVLTEREFQPIAVKALEFYTHFIIDPSGAISNIIFERRQAETLSASQVKMSLDGLNKLCDRWDTRIASAVNVIKPYFSGLSNRPVTSNELNRVLNSSIEKEIAHDSIEAIENNLLSLSDLFKQDPDQEDISHFDYTEPICQMLTNRGLTSWIPGIVVEREIAGGVLDVLTAIRAMHRLVVYRENRLLGAEPEDLTQVEDEVEDFTNFLETVN